MVEKETVGTLALFLAVAIVVILVALITAGIVSIGFSVLPIGILLAVLCIIGYVLVTQPDNIEWRVPYLGKVTIGPVGETTNLNGFDRILAVADEESDDLADSFRAIRFEFDEDSCESIANTVKIGIQSRKSSPFEQTILQMETLLTARDFVEQSDNHELRIVYKQGDTLYAKLGEEHTKIKEGLEFDLYIKDAIQVNGEGDVVSKQVGTARVVQTDNNFCHLEVTSLNERFDSGSEEPLSYIMDHSPTIKFDTERTKGVDWDDLEKAYASLRDLANEENSNHGN